LVVRPKLESGNGGKVIDISGLDFYAFLDLIIGPDAKGPGVVPVLGGGED
jgi:hypothetical protein